MIKIPKLRWVIAFVLCLATTLNYIDRSVFGLLAPTIQKDLSIGDQQYATILNCFLVAYTIAYLISGQIVDRLGVRLSFALFIVWWSISNALTGFARSFRDLSVFRFMLGLGEAGAYTAAPKAVFEWFPASERGFAIGLYSVGSAIGATIAPLLVALIAGFYGWRWVFAVTPLFAALWLVAWLFLYREPLNHPLMTESERKFLLENLPPPAPVCIKSSMSGKERWWAILGRSFIWRLMFARMLTDPVWYFYQFWMPKYLHSTQGVTQTGLSMMALVFLAADVGFLLGGYLAGRSIKRGAAPRVARLRVMFISACLTPLLLFMPFASGPCISIVIAIPIAYALTAWLGNLSALVVDLSPPRLIGTAFGLVACGSAVGGIIMNQVVAGIVTHYSYSACFYLMAFLHPVAFLVIRGLKKVQNPAKATA